MEENREIKSWKLSSRHIVYRNAVLGYFSTLDYKENCSEKLSANAELGVTQRSTSEWYRTLPWLAVRLHWYNGKIRVGLVWTFEQTSLILVLTFLDFSYQPDPGIEISSGIGILGFFLPARSWYWDFWTFHTSLVVLVLDPFKNFHTSLVLIWNPFFQNCTSLVENSFCGWCNTKPIQNSTITLQKEILTHIMIATFQPTRPIIVPYHMK